MSLLLAIDPGSTQSAWMLFDPVRKRPVSFGKEANHVVRLRILEARNHPALIADHLVFEWFEPRGMPVAIEVIETFLWMGRFLEVWDCGEEGTDWSRIPRQKVKLHVCGRAAANDTNIRAAVIDRYGGKDLAIGKKAAPGILYGVAADVWQALALALTWSDQRTLKS